MNKEKAKVARKIIETTAITSSNAAIRLIAELAASIPSESDMDGRWYVERQIEYLARVVHKTRWIIEGINDRFYREITAEGIDEVNQIRHTAACSSAEEQDQETPAILHGIEKITEDEIPFGK